MTTTPSWAEEGCSASVLVAGVVVVAGDVGVVGKRDLEGDGGVVVAAVLPRGEVGLDFEGVGCAEAEDDLRWRKRSSREGISLMNRTQAASTALQQVSYKYSKQLNS